VSQDAATQERAKLLLDEAGRGLIAVARTRQEAFQLLPDDLMKQGLLRLMALVVGHMDPVRDRVWGAQVYAIRECSTRHAR